jgi:hypothetical protein
MKALSVNREERYPSVEALQKEIKLWQDGGAPGEQGKIWKLLGRH